MLIILLFGTDIFLVHSVETEVYIGKFGDDIKPLESVISIV